jgi:hypothetical protein
MDSDEGDDFREEAINDGKEESRPYASGHMGAQSYFKAHKGGSRTSSKTLSGISLPGHSVSSFNMFTLTRESHLLIGSCGNASATA